MDFCFAHFVFRIHEKLHIAQLAKANESQKGQNSCPFSVRRIRNREGGGSPSDILMHRFLPPVFFRYPAALPHRSLCRHNIDIGMLQRWFKIGFNRAARIMDQLSDAGVVGPDEGTKPRKVLMSEEQFENYLEQN